MKISFHILVPKNFAYRRQKSHLSYYNFCLLDKWGIDISRFLSFLLGFLQQISWILYEAMQLHMPTTNITYLKKKLDKNRPFFLFVLEFAYVIWIVPFERVGKKRGEATAESNEPSFCFRFLIAVLNLHWPLRIRSLCRRNSSHINEAQWSIFFFLLETCSDQNNPKSKPSWTFTSEIIGIDDAPVFRQLFTILASRSIPARLWKLAVTLHP